MDESSHKTRKPYLRLFSIPENVKKAVMMINKGYSFGAISKVMKCDRTSIISLYERKIKEGYVFKKLEGERPKLIRVVDTVSVAESLRNNQSLAPKIVNGVNQGRDYKEYLLMYMKKTRPLTRENLNKAKETINEARKKRKEEGNYCEDVWSF